VEIRPVRAEEYEEFVAFLDAGMRPDGAETGVADDFPVILGRDNLAGMLGIRGQDGWIAGLAALVRSFETSDGTLPIAGVGSVVTHPDHRGQGHSAALQRVLMEHLAGQDVPLAVLWTDQPEIYAGRGFQPAGWEYHLGLGALSLADSWPAEDEVRTLGRSDIPSIAALYAEHPLRTRRRPEDHAALYAMPGTRIVGLERQGRLAAFACCGKGMDFPDYVAEWGGAPDAVVALLSHVQADGLASRALVPAGR
jgi:GNAT superfamily N-acetyltransferase